MKKGLLLAVLVVIGSHAMADTTTLQLPGRVTLRFDAPPLRKLKETLESGRYQYVASSLGSTDERYNLSVYAEPISCQYGESTKQVTRCFLEKSDMFPGLMKESRRTACDEKSCSVTYVTAVRAGDSTIVQLHINTIFAYPGNWVDVHFSVINPGDGDTELVARLQESMSYEQ